MKRNLFFIISIALISMAILIPLKATTYDDQGRLEDDDTAYCNQNCPGGGPGTNHGQGTGSNNAYCNKCASIIWEKCENYINFNSICVAAGPHTAQGCPYYTFDPNDSVYNADAREYNP